jgi:hypothetical protein
VTRFDLESAADLALLADPELTLGPLQGLVVLEEIQPAGSETKFLVLGSASPDLLRQSSESLAPAATEAVRALCASSRRKLPSRQISRFVAM